jgi:CDP-6-deoxy-D-xylo-4-hexulose-3-dehydrase
MDTNPELYESIANSLHRPQGGQYWYPLSQPTYGAEEVYQATQAMCCYETTMGVRVREFENAFAEAVGKKHAVMVNSGSSAALVVCMLLRELGLPKGAEVLLPGVTWPTVLWAIYLAGLKPVLVDVRTQDANLDTADLRRAITPNTKAVIPAHILGYPVDMTTVYEIAQQHRLIVIEDCCEAFGTRTGALHVGSRATCAFYSLFFSHHLTTMEGGMICTDNDGVVHTLRMLRSHGWDRHANPSFEGRYRFLRWGTNVRPTEVQAAFGIPQLKQALAQIDRRQELALQFGDAVLAAAPWIDVPSPTKGASPFGLGLYINRSVKDADARDQRTALCAQLENAGIETRPMIAGNIQRQPVASDPRYAALHDRSLPGADYIDARGMYLGLHPSASAETFDRLLVSTCEILRTF